MHVQWLSIIHSYLNNPPERFKLDFECLDEYNRKVIGAIINKHAVRYNFYIAEYLRKLKYTDENYAREVYNVFNFEELFNAKYYEIIESLCKTDYDDALYRIFEKYPKNDLQKIKLFINNAYDYRGYYKKYFKDIILYECEYNNEEIYNFLRSHKHYERYLKELYDETDNKIVKQRYETL